MKKTTFFLVRLFGTVSVLFLAGCQPASVEKEEARQAIAEAVAKKLEIPIDDKTPGAKISLARNFYFIIDGSGSMQEPPDGNCIGGQQLTRKIDGAKWAVHEFIKKVPNDVNLGLYVFDEDGDREVVSLGPNNRQAFLRAVDEIWASGGTPLAEAIRLGTDKLVKQYQKQLGYGEFRLVVVTDGIADRIPEASIYAAEHNIPIYAIGLCIGENHPLRQFAVSYRAADSFEDLKKGLEETLAELPGFDIKEFNPSSR